MEMARQWSWSGRATLRIGRTRGDTIPAAIKNASILFSLRSRRRIRSAFALGNVLPKRTHCEKPQGMSSIVLDVSELTWNIPTRSQAMSHIHRSISITRNRKAPRSPRSSSLHQAMLSIPQLPKEIWSKVYEACAPTPAQLAAREPVTIRQMDHQTRVEYDEQMAHLVKKRLNETRQESDSQLDFTIDSPQDFSDLDVLTLTVPFSSTSPNANTFGALVTFLLAKPMSHVRTLLINVTITPPPPDTTTAQSTSSHAQEVQHIVALCTQVHAYFTHAQDTQVVVKLPRSHSIRAIWRWKTLDHVL
jgi:hypothetical protein